MRGLMKRVRHEMLIEAHIKIKSHIRGTERGKRVSSMSRKKAQKRMTFRRPISSYAYPKNGATKVEIIATVKEAVPIFVPTSS